MGDLLICSSLSCLGKLRMRLNSINRVLKYISLERLEFILQVITISSDVGSLRIFIARPLYYKDKLQLFIFCICKSENKNLCDGKYHDIPINLQLLIST